jgi:N-formylglutamate amidohydrolase
MTKPPFDLTWPDRQTTSLVFASPHSGRDYPWSFLRRSVLDQRSIRSSEDAFVDLLFGGAPRFGAPFLKATMPRAFIDLNRSAEELDPALIEGVRKSSHNPRVTSGLGVVPRVVSNGRPIYRGKIPLQEAHTRIESYWRPYHTALQGMIDESIATFGEAILIDCHSMPHEAIDSIANPGIKRPDVVLGDRFGAAARSDVVERIEAAFSAAGLKVVRNAPFAGAYITQHYGRPSRNQHVVQVELDRSLYMDEATIQPRADFDSFCALMESVVSDLADIGRHDMPLAAE